MSPQEALALIQEADKIVSGTRSGMPAIRRDECSIIDVGPETWIVHASIAAEVSRLRTRIADLEAACRKLGACVEARRREYETRHGLHRAAPTHSWHDWLQAAGDREEADAAVNSHPTAAGFVKEAGDGH